MYVCTDKISCGTQRHKRGTLTAAVSLSQTSDLCYPASPNHAQQKLLGTLPAVSFNYRDSPVVPNPLLFPCYRCRNSGTKITALSTFPDGPMMQSDSLSPDSSWAALLLYIKAGAF